MENLQIQFEFPAILANQAGLTPDNADQETRRILALFLYEHKRISLGKACELANLSYWEFSELNRQFEIQNFYSASDLEEDMERLKDV